MGKLKGRRPLGRPRGRWVDNIRMDLQERGCIESWWGKRRGKRPLGRPRDRWLDNIRMDQQKKGCIGSWLGNWREGDHWGDLGVDGWIILGQTSRMWVYGLDWVGPG